MSSSIRERSSVPVDRPSASASPYGEARWYAVHVAQGSEEATARKCRQLVSSDVLEECFVPKYEKYLKRNGSWRLVVDPLFSEYFFVATRDVRALSKELGRLSFPAVLIGGTDEGYAPLSFGVQAWLEGAFDDAHVLRASEGAIEQGVLKVKSGPLRGREGDVRKINRHKRMAYVRFDDGADGFLLRAALNVPAKD